MQDYFGSLTIGGIVISIIVPFIIWLVLMYYIFKPQKLYSSFIRNMFEKCLNERKSTFVKINQYIYDYLTKDQEINYKYSELYLLSLSGYHISISDSIKSNAKTINDFNMVTCSSLNLIPDTIKTIFNDINYYCKNVDTYYKEALIFNNRAVYLVNTTRNTINIILEFTNSYKNKSHTPDFKISINNIDTYIVCSSNIIYSYQKTVKLFNSLADLDYSLVGYDLNMNILRIFIFNNNYWDTVFANAEECIRNLNQRLERFIIRSFTYLSETEYAFRVLRIRKAKNINVNTKVSLCEFILGDLSFFRKTINKDYRYIAVEKQNSYCIYPISINKFDENYMKELLYIYDISGEKGKAKIERPALCNLSEDGNFLLKTKGTININ